jgi:hypothetical protein
MRSSGFEEYVSPNALVLWDVGRRSVSADGVLVRGRTRDTNPISRVRPGAVVPPGALRPLFSIDAQAAILKDAGRKTGTGKRDGGMKRGTWRMLIAGVVCLLVGVVGTGLAVGGSTGPLPPLSDAAWSDRTIFGPGLVTAAQGVLDELPGATVYHIHVEIAEDLMSLAGHQDVLYTNREACALSEIYFRLYPNEAGGHIEVSSLTVDGNEVVGFYEQGGLDLRVPLSSPLLPGAAVEIGMDFEVTIPQAPTERYGLFSSSSGVLSLDEAFPSIPVYDAGGWHLDPVLAFGDVAVYDASFYLVRVSAPHGLALVGTGVEVAREDVESRQVRTFAAGPARNFYLAVAAGLVTVEKRVGETTIRSVALADDFPAAERVLSFAEAALASFGERFCPYPYTELDLVANPILPGGNAMEYPGAVVLSRPLYDPRAIIWGSVPSPAALEWDVVHEIAHQWFFNLVGNDQVNEPWLDEAMAQYAVGLYYEDAYRSWGTGTARDWWSGNWSRAGREETPIGLPVAAYEASSYSPIVYGRGPFFLASLEDAFSRAAFAAFLEDYVLTFAWDIATTAAFRALAEEHCGCDLGPHFETWVYP